MDKYNETDHYCYEKTKVLKNKLGIENEHDLEKAEKEITSKTIQSINYRQPPYSLEYLENIHKILFGDIYSWAGETRNVNITKGNTQFALYGYISPNIDEIFKSLEKDKYLKGLSKDIFCKKLAYYYCEFNMIHPFREGNGRTQRILFEHLALYCGYIIDWSKTNSHEWLEANISGITDESDMEAIFLEIVSV